MKKTDKDTMKNNSKLDDNNLMKEFRQLVINLGQDTTSNILLPIINSEMEKMQKNIEHGLNHSLETVSSHIESSNIILKDIAGANMSMENVFKEHMRMMEGRLDEKLQNVQNREEALKELTLSVSRKLNYFSGCILLGIFAFAFYFLCTTFPLREILGRWFDFLK